MLQYFKYRQSSKAGIFAQSIYWSENEQGYIEQRIVIDRSGKNTLDEITEKQEKMMTGISSEAIKISEQQFTDLVNLISVEIEDQQWKTEFDSDLFKRGIGCGG